MLAEMTGKRVTSWDNNPWARVCYRGPGFYLSGKRVEDTNKVSFSLRPRFNPNAESSFVGENRSVLGLEKPGSLERGGCVLLGLF